MKSKGTLGLFIATAVAGLIATGQVMAEAAPAAIATKVKCSGINACKGQGSCASGEQACAGKNECKGKGWVNVDSEKDCTDKGGTVAK